jgi:hypothetical protein
MNELLRLIKDNPDQFSDDFIEWLPDNAHVWDAFVREVFRIRGRGYKHYSSYTIVEYLRHHSAVAEKSEHGEWKINNNHRPYLSRLFDLKYPEAAGMFEYRTVTKPRKRLGQIQLI